MLQEYKAVENTWLIIRDLEDFKLPVLLLKDQELITKKPVIEEFSTRSLFLTRLDELEIPYGVNDYIAPPSVKSTKFKPLYKIVRVLTPNTYYSVCNVSGSGTGSGVELTYTGAFEEDVLIGRCKILVNSTNYIYLEGQVGGTKQLAIRIKSDGDDNFIIQVKSLDSLNTIPLLINILPHADESITTSGLTVYNVATLEQVLNPDTHTITSTDNPSIEVNGSLVWHSGNDGPSSGLNADVLDGMQPSSTNIINTVVSRDGTGNIAVNYIAGKTSQAPLGNNSDLLASTAYVQAELVDIVEDIDLIQTNINSINDDIDVINGKVIIFEADIEEIQASTASTPEQILIKLLTVDGAGSGLDADSVDGIQGSNIVLTTGNQTIGGNKTFTNNLIVNGTITSTNPAVTPASLGGTVPGINLFTLPAVSQISYLQVNANNTISALQAGSYQQNLVNNSLINATIATTDLVVLDSWDLNIYRSAKYIIQIVQGTDIQTSEMLVTYIGSNVLDTEYAILMNNGRIGILEADKTSTHVRLVINMVSNISANIKINKKLILI